MTSVIIVDDDKDLAESTAEILVIKGFEVLAQGHNGQDAVELFEKFKPDCTVIDYQMPKYDGIYGLREIRKISAFSKIVVVSGSVDCDLRGKLLEMGANRVIDKPYRIDDLCEAIK